MRVKAAFEVPTKDLGPCIEIRRGISWSLDMERELPSEKTWPVIRIPNVQEVLDTTDLVHLAGIPLGAAQVHKATKDWTIMVGSNGNPERVGNAVFIREDEGYLFASFLVGITPADATDLDPAYLYRYINSPAIQQAITDSVAGTTGLKNISLKELAKLPLPDISISEQCRIAEILDTVDEAIRTTERLIDKLKAIKTGLLHDLLTRGIDENGRLREDSAYSEQHAVGELGVWTGGGTPSKQHTAFWQGGDIPWVTPKDMVSSWIDDAQQHITMEGVRAASLSVHQPGDVAVVFRSGILRHTFPVSAGRVPFVVNQDLKVLHPGDHVDSRYAFHALCALGRRVIQIAVKAGTTVESVDLRTFLAFDLYLPDIHEQQRIVCLLDEADECIFASETKLEKLFFLKQGLMHDLLTGKVRVPIDEEGDDE